MAVVRNILIISHDKVGPLMAGPGIRYHQIAIELSKKFNVTLATFNPSYTAGLKNVPYAITSIKVYDYKKIFDRFDAILALWLSEEMIRYAKSCGKLLIFDMYAPVPIENLIGRLFSGKTINPEDDYNFINSINNYGNFLTQGDYFMCSNPIQKDFWIGYTFAGGSIKPSNYADFPVYDRLGLCPMGINLDDLKDAGKIDPIRERFPQIKKNDFVLLWTGGIWDWFDAETPIRAIKKINDSGKKNVKLVFLGTRHPNLDVPAMDETAKALKLSEELEIKNVSVFFFEGWIEYDRRLDYLLAADVAIYAHKPSIEARYSHRTRVLDHILTCLPTIATKGDYFADFIEENSLGIAVPPKDIVSMVKSIDLLLDPITIQNMKDSIKRVSPEFTWQKTLEPLVAFLSQSHEPRIVSNDNYVASTSKLANSLLARKTKKYIPRRAKEIIKRKLAKRSQLN